MRRGLQNLVLSTKPTEIGLVISLLDLFFRDRAAYETLIRENVIGERQKEYAAYGYLKVIDIAQACLKLGNGHGIPLGTLEFALQRLSEWGFVKVESDPGTAVTGCWRVNVAMTSEWDTSFAENVCFGVLYAIEKHRTAVPYIVVETEKGDEEIGTGFIVALGPQRICVMNKHVAGGERIKSIKRICTDTKSYDWSGCVESHLFDLAAIAIKGSEEIPSFRFGLPIVLDDVIALGYPKVAVTAGPILLAHKGEINGTIVNRYDNQRYLAVSCAVAPGNSGGPLINEAAQVVGVISQSSVFKGIGSTVEQVGVHHLAIPVGDVQTFLRSPEVTKLALESTAQNRAA